MKQKKLKQFKKSKPGLKAVQKIISDAIRNPTRVNVEKASNLIVKNGFSPETRLNFYTHSYRSNIQGKLTSSFPRFFAALSTKQKVLILSDFTQSPPKGTITSEDLATSFFRFARIQNFVKDSELLLELLRFDSLIRKMRGLSKKPNRKLNSVPSFIRPNLKLSPNIVFYRTKWNLYSYISYGLRNKPQRGEYQYLVLLTNLMGDVDLLRLTQGELAFLRGQIKSSEYIENRLREKNIIL